MPLVYGSNSVRQMQEVTTGYPNDIVVESSNDLCGVTAFETKEFETQKKIPVKTLRFAAFALR